jgi:hypothetical protein
MSTSSHLVDWLYPMMKASSRDKQRFGPNAARVRALLRSVPRFGLDEARAVDNARFANRTDLRDADQEIRKAIRDAERSAFLDGTERSVYNAAKESGWKSRLQVPTSHAAHAELVSDLITPEIYGIATGPLATGNQVKLSLADFFLAMDRDTENKFRNMVIELTPNYADDVRAIQRLAQNPNAEGLLQIIMDGLVGKNQPLARQIRAAEMLWKSGRRGKGML